VRAMMDSSDGLSTDLARLCVASGTGAIVEDIPVDPAARALAEKIGADAERWALDGGEDFELLVTIEHRAFAHLANRFRAHFGRDLVRVGRITEGAGVRLANGAAIVPSGWDHVR
jgi:thiamine-monophosphate kinase